MMTVLIADDSKGSRDVVRYLIMKQINAVTKEAANGIAALEIIKTMHIDILITDIKMPVMDGLTATRAIRALERADAKTIPIIAMTANAFEEDARKCLDAGMNVHLAKPLCMEELVATLAQLCA